MGFVVEHHRFVPHTLNSIQQLNRVQLVKQLLKIIDQAVHQLWQFFNGRRKLALFHWKCWNSVASSWTKTFKSIQKNNYVPKTDDSLFWSPLGFKIIEMLPKGCKFNSQYFIESILSKMADLYQEIDQSSPKKFLIHIYNANPHRSNASKSFAYKNWFFFVIITRFRWIWLQSDFYLFGKVKNQLKGSEFDSEDQILNGIFREELESVMI